VTRVLSTYSSIHYVYHSADTTRPNVEYMPIHYTWSR